MSMRLSYFIDTISVMSLKNLFFVINDLFIRILKNCNLPDRLLQ